MKLENRKDILFKYFLYKFSSRYYSYYKKIILSKNIANNYDF